MNSFVTQISQIIIIRNPFKYCTETTLLDEMLKISRDLLSLNTINRAQLEIFFVPTPHVGGGTIYSNGFFLFKQFWPIDIFIVEKCEWYEKACPA